jgi:hypothetical protein
MLQTLFYAHVVASAGPVVPLFPAGKVPGEVPGAVGPEYWENRTLGSGYVITLKKNVSAPTLIPFLSTR